MANRNGKLKFSVFCLLLATTSLCFASQTVVVKHRGSAPATITLNVGGTALGQLEDPNAFQNHAMWTPIVLTSTNPTLVAPNCFVNWGTAQPGSWSCALYGPGATSGKPDGDTKVCNSSTVSNGATLLAFTSIALSGCPSTLTGTAGTVYWLATVFTSSTTQLGNTGFHSYCPNGSLTPGHVIMSNISNATITPWPSTAPASMFAGDGTGPGVGCYDIYVQLKQAPSSSGYDIVSYDGLTCDVSTTVCSGAIATKTAGHGMFVLATTDTSSGGITSVTDTTNGTTTDTFTRVGCATQGGVDKNCAYWIDRVTAGVNGLACTHTNSGGSYKVSCLGYEINGTNASAALDKSEFDTAVINAASFASGNTATTAQANELLIGFGSDGWPGAAGVLAYTTCDNGWSNPVSTLTTGNASSQLFVCIKPVTSTGAYNVSGSSNGGAGSNSYLPGLITVKQ